MCALSGTCEIVELREDLDKTQHLKEANHLGSGPIVDNGAQSVVMQEMACKYRLEDDINKLFEAIDLRASARRSRPSHKLSADSLRKSASKKIRNGVYQTSGIGISESVTLKQALRGLCISHASEIAAMKRLSKSVVGSSKVSESGDIKRLYRAVVAEANESGLPSDEDKGSVVEISLPAFRETPLNARAHSSPELVVAEKTDVSMIKAPKEEEPVPVPTEIERHKSTLKLGQEGELDLAMSLSRPKSCISTAEQDNDVSGSAESGNTRAMLKLGKNLKLNFSSSLLSSHVSRKVNKSSSKSVSLVKHVRKNNCFPNKKIEKEPISACTSCNTCNAEENNGNSTCPSTSQVVLGTDDCNQNVMDESPPALSSGCLNVKVRLNRTDCRATKPGPSLDSCNKRNFDAKVSECSRSREPADFSQTSKSSVGEHSNSTFISEESHFYGSSHSGSRPHMSKNLRWDAIRHVEMQHGSLGLKHFKLLKRLGCGDVGTVYLADLTGTNCLFAVKIMDTDSWASKKMSRAQTERDILQMLDHPFLPTLFAHFTTNKFSILVMDYCPGGDLHILRQRQPRQIFTEEAARFYVAEVLLALEYLHMLGIVYRDLKPENILVREDGHIMLSDFDLSLRCTVKPIVVRTPSSVVPPTKKISRPCMEYSCIDPFCLQPSWVQVPCFMSRLLSGPIPNARTIKPNLAAEVPQLLAEPTDARSNSFVGTHEYLAPEILKGQGHGNAVDWWTFGIFLYELLFGTTPFKGLGNDETLANVVMHGIKFPESPSVSSQAKDLIRGLLVKEPEQRFGSVKGAAEIRQHRFFKGVNWALIRCATPPMLPTTCDARVLLLTSEESELEEFKKTAEEQPGFVMF